jgi:hypothetical protein
MRFTRTAGGAVGLALTLAAAFPGTAQAETITSSVYGASLTLTSQPVTFNAATLTGANQTISASSGSAWSLTNARGTSTGWTATISATDPTSTGGSVETTNRTIPVANLSVSTGTVTAGTGSDPTTNITGASGLALSSSAQTLISSSGTNKGTYTFTPTFSLVIPANAFRSNYEDAVGTSAFKPYTSTVTLSIS